MIVVLEFMVDNLELDALRVAYVEICIRLKRYTFGVECVCKTIYWQR